MIGRIVKRVLHRVIRALIVNRALTAAFVLILFAVIGFGVYQIAAGASLALHVPGGKASSSSAAEDFLKGNQTYDASLIWNSFSDDNKKRYEALGGLQALQAQLNAAREAGSKLEQYTYIGKQDLPDGTSMQFYLVASRGPQSGGQVEYVPYVFTIDQSGKIARVQ
jgi:hypothetical protein